MIYFIGHTTSTTDNAKDYLAEVKAPKNYKDQAKIDEYVEKAVSDQLATASSKPFTAKVKEVYVMQVDDSGKVVESRWWNGPTVITDFMDFANGHFNGNAKVFLMNSSSFMRVACFEALKVKPNSFAHFWLFHDSYVRRCFYDLPKLFLNTLEEQSRIGLFGLFKYYGVSLTIDDLANVKTQAEKLHELYKAIGLSEEVINTLEHSDE
jgi:hypothetical protein